MSKGDWREEANQRLDVIEEKIEELQVSAGKIDALTKQRDVLRTALERAAQEAHRLKQNQPAVMPVPARHHQADSFVECPDAGCPKNAQALAGQPGGYVMPLDT